MMDEFEQTDERVSEIAEYEDWLEWSGMGNPLTEDEIDELAKLDLPVAIDVGDLPF